MPDDRLTAEEHLALADTCQTAGSLCAGIGLLFALTAASMLLAWKPEGLAFAAVAALLIWTANVCFADVDAHHTAAHRTHQ